jgi:hypothetical protein
LRAKKNETIYEFKERIKKELEDLYHSCLEECDIEIPRIMRFSAKDSSIDSFRKQMR